MVINNRVVFGVMFGVVGFNVVNMVDVPVVVQLVAEEHHRHLVVAWPFCMGICMYGPCVSHHTRGKKPCPHKHPPIDLQVREADAVRKGTPRKRCDRDAK